MNRLKRRISRDKLEVVAKVLKVISHPVRLEILEILEIEQTLDVSTIFQKINGNCEISMLSHHLAKMKDNDLLTSYKSGKKVYYTIRDRQILKIFDCIGKCEF